MAFIGESSSESELSPLPPADIVTLTLRYLKAKWSTESNEDLRAFHLIGTPYSYSEPEFVVRKGPLAQRSEHSAHNRMTRVQLPGGLLKDSEWND